MGRRVRLPIAIVWGSRVGLVGCKVGGRGHGPGCLCRGRGIGGSHCMGHGRGRLDIVAGCGGMGIGWWRLNAVGTETRWREE